MNLDLHDYDLVILIPSFSDGVERSITEAVAGIVIALLIRAFLVSQGLESLIFLVNILTIVGFIMILDNIPFWGITYTIGWVFGIFFIGSKIMEWWEVPVYIAIGLFFLYAKVTNKFD